MCAWVCVCSVGSASVTPWTVAHQAPLFVGFSRQEYWSGLPCLLQGIFLTQGLNLHLMRCRQILYHWAAREALTPVQWCLPVVLICIPLLSNGVDHLFMCLFLPPLFFFFSFWCRVCSNLFPFKNLDHFSYNWVLKIPYIFWKQVDGLEILQPKVFLFLKQWLPKIKYFSFYEVHFFSYFYLIVLLVSH